eukprot:764240-Hanusia_phi.AAC.6
MRWNERKVQEEGDQERDDEETIRKTFQDLFTVNASSLDIVDRCSLVLPSSIKTQLLLVPRPARPCRPLPLVVPVFASPHLVLETNCRHRRGALPQVHRRHSCGCQPDAVGGRKTVDARTHGSILGMRSVHSQHPST